MTLLQNEQVVEEKEGGEKQKISTRGRLLSFRNLLVPKKSEKNLTQLTPVRNETLPHVPEGLSRYYVMKLIGKGTYGYISRALDTATGQEMVIKKIMKKQKSSSEDRIANEIKACARIRTLPGTLRAHGYFETEEAMFVAMEHIQGKDLYDLLSERNFTPLSETLSRNIFKQITQSLFHMHNNGVAHKDIKLENIMVDVEDRYRSVLIDFGLAFLFDPAIHSPSSEFCNDYGGSMEYSPPEILARAPFSPEKSDVYSLGVTLYCLLIGSFPYPNMTDFKEVVKLTKGKKKRNLKFPLRSMISEEARDILRGMLTDCPQNRLSVREILEHKWTVGPVKQTSLPMINNLLIN
ncbi:serine/threonine protein kinase [Planoprotostelium fungivorum]|uniref:non-specific serine/threonine protein kinase n=1 Tax=Planoprotostelium fungivorum TaxID=1890364 RepID=A0A2P6N0G0_9EUKA|nr:serine/threonine protein kinase [Planoprotostelium fungivorum]